MSKITTADFRKGLFIEFKGEPHQIVEFQHVNPGKGSAFVRTRLKSLKTGRVQEFTYKSGETIEEIVINTRELQYLYKEGEKYNFMDPRNYEQFSVDQQVLADYTSFIKEGDIYQMLIMEDNIVGIRFPKRVRLKVIETEDAVKGNTVSGASKPATLETGVIVQVPLFIKVGDIINLDPETGTYIDRG